MSLRTPREQELAEEAAERRHRVVQRYIAAVMPELIERWSDGAVGHYAAAEDMVDRLGER